MHYKQEKNERLISQMVSTTSSTGIRNPLNSIHCHSLNLKNLVDQLTVLLEAGNMSSDDLRGEVNKFKDKFMQFLEVNL
jgi:hypothetical protein